MRPIRFSECYGVTRDEDHDDWFDPLLNEDTHLFIDPFLIFLDTHPDWANAHGQLMEFFNAVMNLLADSAFQEGSLGFQKAKNLMLFPEPPEFCLGLSKKSIFGSGSARGLQVGMLKGAATAINLGLESLKHFEELALLGELIGADRISDITSDVLKEEFISYTQAVADRHQIPLSRVDVKSAGWDPRFLIWKPGLVELPLNPVASDAKGYPVGVILTPRRFLRRHPSIDPDEFWDYAWANEGEQLKADLNYEISQNVDRKTIADLARRKRPILSAYVDSLADKPKAPYDIDEDPDLLVHRADFGKYVANTLSVDGPPETEDQLLAFVDSIIENFKYCVEQRGSWNLLWLDGHSRSRGEPQCQLLFQTSAEYACELHDVDMSREPQTGRGNVDFKVSRGAHLRSVIEVKLAKSTHFWRNLENQTPTYSKAERTRSGCFLVIQFTDKDCEPEFVKRATDLAATVAEANDMAFRAVFVDARPKLSASLL